MRASSQRHLASARGSLLLAWLPRPGRGARSPPALGRRSTPVSRSRLRGEVLDPPRLGFWGVWVKHAPRRSPGRGAAVWVCLGRVWAAAAQCPHLGRRQLTPFHHLSPQCQRFPPCLVPGQRFLVFLLSSRLCVCWHSWRQCWSAREALLSPGSSSQAPGHAAEGNTRPLL